MSRFTRFVRVNLIGLLALMNVLAVFLKFKVERPQTITYKCTAKHQEQAPDKVARVGVSSAVGFVHQPAAVPRVPPRHAVQGDWDFELKQETCDYTSAIVEGVPTLQTGTNRYLRRGDLTRWGRVQWIGADFFTTEKCMVKLGTAFDVAANEGGKL